MDYEAVKIWIDIGQFLATSAVGLYVYVATRHRVTHERITSLEDQVDTRLDDHVTRLVQLETGARVTANVPAVIDDHAQRLARLESGPNHEDLKRLHVRIDEVGGAIRRLEGEFSGANHTLRLIHEHLLSGGNK